MRTGLLLILLLTPTLALANAHKAQSTVSGMQVMLSDVFEGIPFEQDKVLASAPAPGRQMTYNARDLAALARVHGIAWQAQSTTDSATITRASQNFDATKITAAIATALEKQGIAQAQGRTNIALDNTATELAAPTDKEVTLSIDNLTLTPNGQRFSGVARIIRDGQTYAQAPVSGRVTTLVNIPVLARLMKKGDVIKAGDLGWQDVELTAANTDVITDIDDLLGKTPRNNLRPGLPLRDVDLLTPALITKGMQVSLSYQVAGMKITTTGRALADGAQGDVIRVVNLASSRTIEGRIINGTTVRVGFEAQQAALTDDVIKN